MKLLRETKVLWVHYEKILLRNPFWILASLFQPICYLYLFAPILNSIQTNHHTSAINMFAPGLLIMVSLFSVMFVGYGMIDYLRGGVIERLRVTTACRLSLLLGLVLRDVLTLLAQSLIVMLLALPLGLAITPMGMFLTLAMMILIGLCISPASYALALTVQTEDALGPILNFFSQPLLLLSGVLLPLTLAPAWLQNISAFNPLKYAVDASRAIFNGQFTDGSVWKAFCILTALVILSFWWSLHAMKKVAA